MTPRKPIVLAILVLAAGVLAASAWWYTRGNQSAADVLVLHGNVDIRQVELAFNANGRVARVLVHEGDRVRKGQLLAAIDTVRLSSAVAEAQARVAAQREVVTRLEAGSRPEEIRKARADAEAARVDVKNTELQYQRQQELAAKHYVSQQQVDNARFGLEAAQARLKAIEEALRLAELGPRVEDKRAAKATLAANEAALAIAQRDLAEGALVAPSDGVIENRILEPGDMASPAKPAITLALTDPLWVRTYVPEADLGKLRLGGSAEIATDSYPDARYGGWVGFISPTAEFTPKSVETQEVRTTLVYQVRVFVCNPRNELRLGMPATVRIALNQPAAPAGADRCPEER